MSIRECFICGLKDYYDEGWWNIMVVHGKGYTGWEEYLYFCSDKCKNESLPRLKELKKNDKTIRNIF